MRITRSLSFKKVNDLLKVTTRKSVEVGFWGDFYPNRPDITVAEVAVFNEFGTSVSPPRPFMRQAFKDSANHINLIRWTGRKIINGQLSMEQALGIVGAAAVKQVKRTIETVKEPGNAPSTIARKGENNPLIDSRIMINSVKHRIV